MPDMFNFQAQCENTCESLGNPTAATIFGIAAVVTVWLVMNFQTQFECLDSGVSFLQIMSTIFSYSSLYSTHSDAYQNIVTLANLINLNVDYVSPSCIMPDKVWPLFTGGFYALVLIPIIPFAICGILYGMARVWAKYIKRESVYGFHFGFMVQTKELAWQYLLRCFKASVPFPGIVYNNMCQACFNIFSCQQLRNGVTVMAAAPAIVCWESEKHKSLVIVAIIALIVYVFGVPIFTLGSVVWARRKDMLRDPDVLVAFGFFYTWYKPKYYWWGILPYVRRFFLNLCVVVFRTRPAIQAGVAIGVITIATLCQLAAPYWDWRVSALEFFCCFSITFNCVALLYYNDADFATPGEFSTEPKGNSRLDSILVFVNAVNIAAIVGLFVLTYIELKFKKWSVQKLSISISHLAVRVQKGVIEHRDGFFKALHMSSPGNDSEEVKFDEFASAVAKSHDGTSSAPTKDALAALFYILKLVQGDDNPHSLHLSPSMRKSLASADTGVRKGLLREAFGDDKIKSGELKRLTTAFKLSGLAGTFSPRTSKAKVLDESDEFMTANHWHPSLIFFVTRKICWEIMQTLAPIPTRRHLANGNEATMVSLFNISAWLAPVIPDYSEIGAYSGSLSAHVYNEAAANLPQLLIMLSFGDPVLNSSLKAFLEHLVLAEELLTRKDRRMTDKVVFKDRGPLLYWLANEATAEQRREFAVLLTSLHSPEESTGNTPTEEQTEQKNKRSMSTLMKSDAWNKIIPRRFSAGTSAVPPSPQGRRASLLVRYSSKSAAKIVPGTDKPADSIDSVQPIEHRAVTNDVIATHESH